MRRNIPLIGSGLHRKGLGPSLGKDNEYVYKEILGLTDDEISDLLIEGVITTDADLPGGGHF